MLQPPVATPKGEKILLSFRLGIPVAIQVIAVAPESEKEKTGVNNTHLHPRPNSFQPRDPQRLPAEVDFWVAAERGTFHLTLASFLHPVETLPPKA